jgi:hypothetical protein
VACIAAPASYLLFVRYRPGTPADVIFARQGAKNVHFIPGGILLFSKSPAVAA